MSEILLANENKFKGLKSKYIIKFIFSYLNEKIKLEIIKYNKTLQNFIDIKLINYKFLSDSYIVYETNKKGKQYYGCNDSLKFEGEYLNNKRNGKGKEYDLFGNLIFEGEYLNGKRDGKGKEYYNNNRIKLEGEFKDGLRWNGKGYDQNNNIVYELKNGKGYVIEYNDEGDLEFEGDYLNGKNHGKGKVFYCNGKLEFEIEFLNGKINGKGKEYYADNNIMFEGEYFNGFRYNGKGYDKNNNVVYELKNGKGYAIEYNEYYKLIFEGEYLYGKRNGKGKEYNDDGNLEFEGEYLNDKKMGKVRNIMRMVN